MKNNLLTPDSSKKNFAFQFAYQFVILVIPFIVSPYLTRTLGSTSLGIYAYTYSIAYYFVDFAMLGINTHGQRIISQRRDDVTELRRTFWSLFLVHVTVSILAIAAYVCYVLFFCKEDINIAWAQAIYVISALFDITWLFWGLEKFKMVAIRNFIIKIATTSCIFIFIQSPSDVLLYTVIKAVSTCVAQIALFPQVVKEIPPIHFKKEDYNEHIKPLLVLFIGSIAISLYTVFDKTLLGAMLSKESVAFYEYSDRIIAIPKAFISISSIVLYPKACKYAAEKDYSKMQDVMSKTLAITSIIGFASCFGLVAIAKQFATLYYGIDFTVCGDIISLMAPLILILGIGDAVRRAYIFPMKMDATMNKIFILNAIVNLVISALLIPMIGISGAVIGTIAAELTGLIIELYLVKKYITFKWVLGECLPYAIIGIIMYVSVKTIGTFLNDGWVSLGIQVLLGAGVYLAGTLAYMYCNKRELLESSVKSIKNKLKHKGK